MLTSAPRATVYHMTGHAGCHAVKTRPPRFQKCVELADCRLWMACCPMVLGSELAPPRVNLGDRIGRVELGQNALALLGQATSVVECV